MTTQELKKDLENEIMIYAKNGLLDEKDDEVISSFETIGDYYCEKLKCGLCVIHYSDKTHLCYDHDVYYIANEDIAEKIAKEWFKDYCRENDLTILEIDNDNEICVNDNYYYIKSEDALLNLLDDNEIPWQFYNGIGCVVIESFINEIEQLLIKNVQEIKS